VIKIKLRTYLGTKIIEKSGLLGIRYVTSNVKTVKPTIISNQFIGFRFLPQNFKKNKK
jgi:hypothetical protein